MFFYPAFQKFSSDTESLMDSLLNHGVVASVKKAQGPCAAIFYDVSF